MKKILVLNFFPAFTPPTSGGELRYYHLYRELSGYFDITLLSPTYSTERAGVVSHSKNLKEYRVPKEKIHDRLHLALDRQSIGPECSALVCALSANCPNEYHRAYLKLYPHADIIIHEFPYMVNYDLFLGVDGKPRVYNSHNLESRLVEDMWSGVHAQRYKEFVSFLEEKLTSRSNIIFATSAEEKKGFVEMFDIPESKIGLAPNGINPGELLNELNFSKTGRKKVLFIGSSHPPNVEAAGFIIDELSKSCPEVDFLIAGACCSRFERGVSGNVMLLGGVDESRKKVLFRECDLAVNPMFSGAGTNLKALEFLSSGLPLVSTETGLRGLDVVPGVHCVKSERGHFARELKGLLADPDRSLSLSKMGRSLVNEKYSWERIARGVAAGLEKLPLEKTGRSILVLNDFSVANPSLGGQVRINRLYSHLSRECDIVLLSFNKGSEIRVHDHTRKFREISFPKSRAHLKRERRLSSKYPIGVSDIVSAEMCVHSDLMVSAVNRSLDFVDLIVLSHPYMARLVQDVDNVDILYEAHNFEYGLKKSILGDHPDGAHLVDQVHSIEKLAVEKSKFLLAVSHEDARGINELFGQDMRVYIVRNGVEMKDESILSNGFSSVKTIFSGRPVVVFVGSSHRPNIDSLEFIARELAPRFPGVYFLVIGSVCDSLHGRAPANVVLCGQVANVSKDILFRIADVGINPVLAGSGSNLKLADYFSLGLPVVTTTFGARGFDIEHNREALIGEPHELQRLLGILLRDREMRKRLGENGYRYASEHLDWKVLARKYLGILQRELWGDKKKLLVLTQRFTNPPLGGAERYLFEVLKVINKLGDFRIDVATLNIHDISNRYHFCSEFTRSVQGEGRGSCSDMPVRSFDIETLSDSECLKNSRRIFGAWCREFVQTSLKFLDFYDRPLLLGGWNFPEQREDGDFSIWSSGRALVYLPGAERVSLKGFSLHGRNLNVLAGGKTVFSGKVSGHFTVEADMKGDGLAELRVKPVFVKGDPRQLGVFISSIRYFRGGELYSLPLNYCYRDFLKAHHLSLYLDDLIETAMKRDDEIDRIFQESRGPLSKGLEAWLNKHINEYDLVLGHSIPFRTAVLAEIYGKKRGVPVAIHPFFHFDDEFYHWKSYYRAMSRAEVVFASPDAAIPVFFDKLGAKSCKIPGGGIDRGEFTSVDSGPFRLLYRSDRPFVLVLGRKSGSKNYETVIEAAGIVNSGKERVNVVLIGPDEDGKEVESGHALFLGEQPRPVVLGALKDCLALVNMSDSESFGIVILEAWMLSRPVVVNERCAAFRELVKDRVNGFLANPGTLPRILDELIADPALGRRLGRQGRQSVGNEYFWENIGRKVNDTLLKVARGSRKRAIGERW